MRRFNVVLALASFVALASQQPAAASTPEPDTNRIETSVPAYALRDDGRDATYITINDDVCRVSMHRDADTGERYIELTYC